MRYVIPVLLFALLFVMSCSNLSNNSITPNDTPDIPVISTEIGDFPLVPADYRSAQAVTPGTDMTVGQLKCYFTTNCIKATFPKFYWKLVCPFFKVVIYAQPDADVLSWVVTTEANGVDVPTAAQAQAAGWLTPIC